MAKHPEKESNRSQQPPPPPPVNTGMLIARPDGTPDPEVGGHIDRTQKQEGFDKASKDGESVKLADNDVANPDSPSVLGSEADDPASFVPTQAPLAPSMGIAVKAIRAGFYRQQRLNEGDFFNIASMEDWGDWMVFADEKAEAQRQKDLRAQAASDKKEKSGR